MPNSFKTSLLNRHTIHEPLCDSPVLTKRYVGLVRRVLERSRPARSSPWVLLSSFLCLVSVFHAIKRDAKGSHVKV